MKKNKTVYVTPCAAYTDKLMAEASADEGNYIKANLAYVGRHVYALIRTMDYDGPYFHLNEVVKVFYNLRSAVRSNEWKAAIADAADIHGYGDCVMCTCCTSDNVHYTIVAIDVYKGRYFRRKSFGPHTKLITSGLIDSRKIEYDYDDGCFYTTAAFTFRHGIRGKNICHILGYDVIETKDCYKVYDGNTMLFALPPDISFMGLISKVGAIDGHIVNGWWE